MQGIVIVHSILVLGCMITIKGQPQQTDPSTCPPGCEDVTPEGSNMTCAQQADWNKCDEEWMSTCQCSCGLCPNSPTDGEASSQPTDQAGKTVQIPSCRAVSSRSIGSAMAASTTSAFSSSSLSLGFAVGGARGIDNFRRNIEEGYLPLPQDLTYEGIFNDYYFDLQSAGCEKLFCPAYSGAITPDPIDPEAGNELYLAVGLDSGLSASDFSRKPLNLVVVLDISGSMSSPFDQYYYDGVILRENDELGTDKIDVALEAIGDMLNHLNDNDRLSFILFESEAYLSLSLTKFSELNKPLIQEDIKKITPCGGTNMEAGYKLAVEQLDQCSDCSIGDLAQYENRIIFITDAQPNTGDISGESLAGMVQREAQKGIFTTVIGVGLDFNSELIEALTKTRGANYYNIYTPSQFRTKLDEEFDYMVTPLVFDLKLEIAQSSFNGGNGWKVIKVYGSPNVDGGLDKEGTLIQVDTLFPTPTSDAGIKGGVILLKLQKPQTDIPLVLTVSYKDRDTQQTQSTSSTVDVFESIDTVQDGENAVQKAILLARYVDLLRGWIIDQHRALETHSQDNGVFVPSFLCQYYPEARVSAQEGGCDVQQWVVRSSGILPVFDFIIAGNLGRWERQSIDLSITQDQKDVFTQFLSYMQRTIQNVGDSSLSKEEEIIQKLIGLQTSQ
eukprot:TRINITY_DN2859_c0_g2_i1.p1 TRINITY_DN2859_c0_g2~~TRINITY_DN2859_c0_g2_i1.p1  ORF type:complete len:718 (-),score=64.40 TRINITY_DN2859_c0_g2_i1:367-2376(-)